MKKLESGAWPCVCLHPRVAHKGGCTVCECGDYDSAPCLRGSDGCEIPGRHDLCGMMVERTEKEQVMSGHTPGPWVFDAENNGNESGYGNGITTDRDGWTLAHLPHRNPDWQANARLIAAAPDLLAACIELVVNAGCEGPDDDNGPTGEGPCGKCAPCRADAVIAKAEGR